MFRAIWFKITAGANLHVVNFLDVTFGLNNGKFKPYRKPNDDPLYINRHSKAVHQKAVHHKAVSYIDQQTPFGK